MRSSSVHGVLLSLCLSCGAAEVAPVDNAEPMPTGRDCAMATTRCGGGRCIAEIDNQCKLPITCRLSIESICQTSNGEVGPANASTKEVTTLGAQQRTLEATASCGQGVPITTRVTSLECI